MNELMWMQMFGVYAGAGIDVAAIIAFVAFAVLYFLAPVVGYEDERSAGMLTAMYLMAAQVGVMVLQLVVNWSQVLSGSGGAWLSVSVVSTAPDGSAFTPATRFPPGSNRDNRAAAFLPDQNLPLDTPSPFEPLQKNTLDAIRKPATLAACAA